MSTDTHLINAALKNSTGKPLNLTIKDGSVTNTKLSKDAVSTDKIQNEAVTEEKISSEALKSINDKASEASKEAATKADEARERMEQTMNSMKEVIDSSAIKDDGGNLVPSPFKYVQNKEFIFAMVDAEDKLLAGIQWDGTPVHGKTSSIEDKMQSQIDLIANRVATIIGDEDTTNVIDTMNELKTFFANIENTETLTGILTNLDNVAKNLDKTTIKDEEGNIQDTPFKVIENEEFIHAITDSEDRLLFGIYRETGKPYFPLNEMYHVEQNEEFFAVWLDAADHVLLGIRRDGEIIGEIHAVNALKQVISQLQSDLTTLQEKVGTIDTSLQELLSVFSLQENEEYLAVETDAEGKILSSTNPDGSHYIYNAKSETIPTEFEHIEDPEGRMEITTDAEGKVLGYRDKDGTRFENSFMTKKLSMPSDGLSDFAKQLSKSGLTSSGACDWSNYISNNGENPLQLPIPNCAIINISNADKSASWAESKKSNFAYTLEYSDMQGNYFKKNIIMNAQGNSSLMMVKKNASIDLFDESVYDSEGNKGEGDAFSIKFGDWVAQDGFHLKAFYNDFFKGCSFIVYQIANEVMKSYGLTKDRPWKRALIGDYKGTGQDGKQIDDISLQIDNGARCMPDGFPCIAYLNGSFYGIFTFALKKHRDNYHMSKKKAGHIHLDGTNQTFFDGTIKWSDFEVRNPKDSEMCCTTLKEGTTEYEPYAEGKELLGDDAEYFDSKNNAHVLSNRVKRSIESLSKRLTEVKAISTSIEQKTYIEKYFDVDSILDYILVATATHETDGSFANWQWITYDGIKWYICNYDKDRSFGNNDEYMSPAITDGSWMYEDVSIFKFFEDLYSKELKDKWNEYVQKGIFTYENFIGKVNSWVQRIGQANYEKEYDKWKEAPCNRDNLSDTEHWELVGRAHSWAWYNTYKEGSYCSNINTSKIYKAIKQSHNISVTNTEYWKDITYENDKQYNVDDICGYGFSFGSVDNGFYVFKAIVDTVGNVPIKGTYGSYPRVMGYRDNIWRISNYIKQTLETIQRFVDTL